MTPRPQGLGPRRLQVVHHTGFRYSQVVTASFNEVRMTPADGGGQSLLSHRLDVTPAGAVLTYTDYWGAYVESFDVHVPHDLLQVTATSVVITAGESKASEPLPWAGVRSEQVQDRFAEFVAGSQYVDVDPIDDRAAVVEQMAACPDPRAAAHLAMQAVRDHLAYSAGVTSVNTSASEAWATGQGVCQDFTHTTLSLLRSVQIPARYVSGYLHTEHPSPDTTVTGESHAWVEFWDGDWVAIDPTNNRHVGPGHVIVARGRDYADVPPLKGIYSGGTSQGLGVRVEITQLGS